MRFPRLPTWRNDVPTRLHSKWIEVNGSRVHARVSNHEEYKQRMPVVVVHGLSMSSRYMLPTAARLAARYCVYVPDLPGFGKSENPPRVLNIRELADALLAWMDALHLGRAALLGNSLGCQIILDLAVRHPERVSRIILAGPTVDPHGRNAVRLMARTAWDALNEPPSLLAIALYDYFCAGLPRSLQTLQYTLQDRVEDKLPHVKIPTLIVRGAQDRIVPQDWVEYMHHWLPLSRLEIIPDAAHGINYSRPRELAGLTQDFIEEQFTHEVQTGLPI